MLVVHLGRALKLVPSTGLSLRPLIVLSIIVYLFAIVCIGQLRHKGQESGRRIGPPGVDATPMQPDDADEDATSPAGVIETSQHVKRHTVARAPSNSIGVGPDDDDDAGSRPEDDRDDDDDEDDDDNDDDDRDGELSRRAKKQKSTGGSPNEELANQPSLINRIMNFGGFGRAAGVFGGAGEQREKNGQELERARFFKLGLLIGR